MSKEDLWIVIGRSKVDLSFGGQLLNNFEKTIKDAGYDLDIEEIEVAKNTTSQISSVVSQLPSETQEKMNKIQMEIIETTLQTSKEFQSALTDTVKQIEGGYRAVMTMYEVAFYLGIALILFSIFFAVWKGEVLLSLVFGGLGITDVIAYFITKPPLELQDSRANLAQLQATYFNWFNDMYNWNSYLGYLSKSQYVRYQDLKDISMTMLENTEKTLNLIDDHCKLGIIKVSTSEKLTNLKNLYDKGSITKEEYEKAKQKLLS